MLKLCVYLCVCVYFRDVAVSFVTEGEITLPTTQTESIRNKKKNKTYTRLKKKKTLSSVTPVVLSLLLYTEQREAETRKREQQRH